MKKISFQLNKTTLIITILLLAMHQFCYLVPNVIMGFLYDYLLFIFCLVFLGFYFEIS